MEFREATTEDLKVCSEHSLHELDTKSTVSKEDFAFVLDHGDHILCAGGFQMITDVCAWAWIMPTKYVGSHWVPTIRVIKEWMEIWCKEHEIVRLQAWVKVGFDEGIRTAEHLGFIKEYKMNNFIADGVDAWLYVLHIHGV